MRFLFSIYCNRLQIYGTILKNQIKFIEDDKTVRLF
jgi:hypothetical protein